MLKTRIETKLSQVFGPSYLKVTDDSHLHVGHENSKPGGETHFSVILVSPAFSGQSLVIRHQRVYACLKEEFKDGIHALSLKVLCPEEMEVPHEFE